MSTYRRHYRAEPRPEAIRGADMVKCLAGTGAAVFAALVVWILIC